MSNKNKFVKFMGYISIGILAFAESYLIALVCSGAIASFICSVWSFITPLPDYISRYYGVLVLQGAIPISIGFFIFILRNARK